MRKTTQALGATLLVAGLFASGGSLAGAEQEEAREAPRGAATTYRVKMRDDVFRPRSITISRGDRIRWINRGDRVHTTTSTADLWHASLAPGERFTKRFRRAGTYRYVCTLHSGMSGTIVVT